MLLIVQHYQIQLVPLTFQGYFSIQLGATPGNIERVLHTFVDCIFTIYQICDLGQDNYSESEGFFFFFIKLR